MDISQYASAFPSLSDEDFIAAGFSPEEVAAYRGQASTNILDLPNDQFLFALDELGVTGEQRDFLLREKRRKDSPIGGVMEIGGVDEGMRRGAILPIQFPSGMSGLDAIRSGSWDWAVPALFTGLASETARAVDAPRAAYAGQIPEGDVIGEATNLGGILQLGGAAAAGKAVGSYDPTTTRIFAGPKAATANKKMLEKAKKLAASGADKNQIWNETGWFQLGDGQWRFEIDDRDLGLRRPGEAARMADDMRGQAKDITAFLKQRREDLKTQPDLFPETIRKDNAILTREAERLRREASSNYGPEWNPSTVGQRATYALTDSEMQRAYPELMRETIVRTEQQLGGPFGGYTEGLGNLDIAPAAYIESAGDALQRDPRGTLLHEMQHAVQGFEGFSRGTNTSRARELLMNMRDEAIGAARNRYSELFTSAPDELQKIVFDYSAARMDGDLEKMLELESRAFAFPKGRDLIEANNAVHTAVNQTVNADAAFDAYRRHLGELEARLVQERRDWTPAQRRATPPWVMENYIPEERQIKSFEVGPVRPKDILLDDVLQSEWDQLVSGDIAPTMYRDPVMSAAEDVAAPTGIKAYHGSPHDFDRFSMDKIGTGEGAQAYGHGLYFAEAEPVARGYRDALAGGIDVQPVQIDGVRYDPPTEQHQRVAAIIAKDGRRNAMATLRSLRDQGILMPEQESVWKEVLAETKGKSVSTLQGGRMYEVNINANPEDFLDWDKPLREQPEVAKRLGYSDAAVIAAEKAKLYKAFQPPKGDTFEDLFAPLSAQEKAAAEKLAFMPEPWNEMTGKDAWNRAAQRRFSVMQDDGSWGPGAKTYEGALQMAGGDINKVRTLSDPSRQSRAEFMREAGIPGIKYFDAMSRGAGEGSRNFVVFDENLIEIVRKYGIAGAAALLGVSALDVEQAIAENVPQSEWDKLVVGQ